MSEPSSNSRRSPSRRSISVTRGRQSSSWKLSNTASSASLVLRSCAASLCSFSLSIRSISGAQERNTRLAELAVFESFQELDWRPLVTEIERLDGERRELEDGSDILRTLQQQLE